MRKFNPVDLVMWFDKDVLVVNKPSGLPTLVDGYESEAPFLVGIMKTVLIPFGSYIAWIEKPAA